MRQRNGRHIVVYALTCFSTASLVSLGRSSETAGDKSSTAATSWAFQVAVVCSTESFTTISSVSLFRPAGLPKTTFSTKGGTDPSALPSPTGDGPLASFFNRCELNIRYLIHNLESLVSASSRSISLRRYFATLVVQNPYASD
ncbi:hypothetical protein MUK42_17439 [Musa troglodytarum]|uniref:Secreted protein n=1 Tax=Musa troglodytarum TaxID=320322 RepID=A0A9E7HYE0_9LILI|nr:hypothetical protein MUK42_17439 [Musa troglodytarum]